MLEEGGSSKIQVDTERGKPSLSWRQYLKSVFEFVFLKGLIDLSISVVLVTAFYAMALLLTQLLPERLHPMLIDARTAVILLGLAYLVSLTAAATVRFLHLVRGDLMLLHSAMNQRPEGRAEETTTELND